VRSLFFAMKIVILLTAVLPIPATGGTADESSPLLLKGRHGLMLHAGLLNRSTVDSEVSSGSLN